MTIVEEQILETWRIHNRTMIYFIENTPDEALAATLSTRGGRNVARQLAHLVRVRCKRLTAIAKKRNLALTQFNADESPPRDDLVKAFEQSGVAMEEHIKAALGSSGQPSNFKRGVVPMIGYYIAHESHHRGHAVLTIKQSKISLSDKVRVYIWSWNKL